MLTYSLPLELAALRSVTCDDIRVVNYLLPRVSADIFAYEHTGEAWVRADALLKRYGEMPRWGNLIEDPTISQEARRELSQHRIDPVRTRKEADYLLEGLERYRKLRIIAKATIDVQTVLAGEGSVEIDDLTDTLNEALQGTRGRVDLRDHTTTMGGVGEADIEILRKALTGTRDEFIPTGIRVFDEASQGVPRGVSWVLAGTTGGGKSVMLMQVAMHMARMGARVVLISLEMNRTIVVRRMLSALSGLPLRDINAAHRLDGATLRGLKRTWMDFHDACKRNGGRFKLVHPPEDISMDEIFATYRPERPDLLGIDYLGLTKGMAEEDQWRRMGEAVRRATRYAATDNNIIAMLAQLSAEGMIRYSKTIIEHARLAWTWMYIDEEVRDSKIVTIRQPKSTNLAPHDFSIRENFSVMRFEDLDPGVLRQMKEERGARRGGKGGRGKGVSAPAPAGPRASISDDRPAGRTYAQPEFRL